MNDVLLPGEKVLATRPANLMFGFDADAKIADGVSPLGLLLKLAPIVVKARSIGGKIHVTNYRLYFASNRLNTMRGTCSVFLPTIAYDEPVVGPFAGQWVVKTGTVSHRYAVRDPKELSQLLRQTREKPLDLPQLREHVRANLDKVSQGISAHWESKELEKSVEAKKLNSIQLVGLMGAHELFT